MTETAKLTPADAADNDQFGAVAVDGDTVIVGAWADDHAGGVDAGSAYVFDLTPLRNDCNQNGVPDECDIANCPPLDASCLDCNMNAVPDGCEGGPMGMCPNDCSGNGFCDCDTCICDVGWSGTDCGTPICGDGLIRGAEGCDDLNTLDGDGCSATCAVEPGWSCTGEPSVCSSICGDGLILGAEQCDDNNTIDGDGCSAACTVEPGWVCTSQPSVCSPDCNGNTIPDPSEPTTTLAFRVQCPNPPGPCADGVPWSFLIDWEGPDITGDCGPVPTPEVPQGDGPPDLSREFAQCIAAAIEAAGLGHCLIGINQPGNGAVFRVTVPGTQLAICVGPAGGPANCCVADNNDRCDFNPELVLFQLPAVVSDPSTTRALTMSIVPPAVSPVAEAAIQISMVDLQNPAPSNNSCCPPPDFSAYESATCTANGEMNNCTRWVGPPITALEAQDLPGLGSYRAARLQCTPYYRDWANEDPVHLIGAEVIPSSSYQVRLYPVECAGEEPTCFAVSDPISMTTRRAGDISSPYAPGSPGQPNALDVANAVNHFKKLTGAPKKTSAQVQPNVPDPNTDLNALDIAAIVENVKLAAYPYSGPCACPSAVPCDAVSCTTPSTCTGIYGAGAMCVKTCIGGANAGLPCNNNKHCNYCAGGAFDGLPCDPAGMNSCPGGACSSDGVCGSGSCRDRCGRCD